MGVFDPMRMDDSSSRIIRIASYAIRCMKALKLGSDGAADRVKNHIEPPQEYTCNGVLMANPVITTTGEVSLSPPFFLSPPLFLSAPLYPFFLTLSLCVSSDFLWVFLSSLSPFSCGSRWKISRNWMTSQMNYFND